MLPERTRLVDEAKTLPNTFSTDKRGREKKMLHKGAHFLAAQKVQISARQKPFITFLRGGGEKKVFCTREPHFLGAERARLEMATQYVS